MLKVSVCEHVGEMDNRSIEDDATMQHCSTRACREDSLD
jgi:hypothetical protein